jgi:hypothetical protein
MWTTIILFIILLFLYIHIQHQYKSGQDLQVYEYDYSGTKDLIETVNFKQPILFELDLPPIPSTAIHSLKVKDVRDYQINSQTSEPILLPYHEAKGLLDTDTKSVFYSNQNHNMIHDSSEWSSWFQEMDALMKPDFCINKTYDMIYGSAKSHTTTQYFNESHVFVYLPPETNKEAVRVKMTPWKSRTFMDPQDDYIYYEFWSKENLFSEHLDSRIQCLDFVIKPGHVFYIPPYWFHSFMFPSKENQLCMAKYTTIANALAHAKQWSKYYLQQQNIQEKWLKPLMDNSGESAVDKNDVSSTTLLPESTTNNDESNNLDKNTEIIPTTVIEPTKPTEEIVAEELLCELKK